MWKLLYKRSKNSEVIHHGSVFPHVMFPGEPDVTLTVTPPIPVEGQDATLTCSFTSHSLPSDYRPTVHYRWWRDDTETGQDDRELVINPVTSEHHGVVYRCQGQEEDSAYAEDSTVTLDVTRKCLLESHRNK